MAIDEQLRQLGDARKLVLGDSAYYPQIIQGILPIIGPDARLELRRWGAEFLAETFSTPSLPVAEKERLSLTVLSTLRSMIENQNEDSAVVKSVIQTAASIYPLVFRWIVQNPYDTLTWDTMTTIKSRILKIWESASTSIRICCIKFAQRIVLAQTAGADTEKYRGDVQDISILMVPSTHALLPSRNLEAEASGLLDRLLSVLYENTSDAVLIDATLNSLSVLIRARPSISQKILNAVLAYNPLKLATSSMTPKLRVMIKSMEKTTRMLLIHISKRDPHNSLTPKIHQQIDRLYRTRSELFDETNRKRGPPETTDEGFAKRQRLHGASDIAAITVEIPPLGPGSHSVAEFFTATNDDGLKAFDVGVLNEDLVVKIVTTLLVKIGADVFNQTINGIRQRYLALSSSHTTPGELDPNTAPLGIDDDDDEYEPDFQVAEDNEQILNKLDGAPPEEESNSADQASIGPLRMPTPPPMTTEETARLGTTAISRVLGLMQSKDEAPLKRTKSGIHRLAANNNDKESWSVILSRLATRPTTGLNSASHAVKTEEDVPRSSISATIRESLYRFVLEDFRKRTDMVVAWLCEEWYNDNMKARSGEASAPHYEKWVIRVLDGITPYLDARDKFLTRFLGEIPGLSAAILDRVKALCHNPAMVGLAVNSLYYLVVMRPPAREISLDAMQDIWEKYDDAKPIAAKYLGKYRPGYLENQDQKTRLDEKKTDVTGSEGIAAIS